VTGTPHPKQKNRRQLVGAWGERLAETYITQLGWKIIERNHRTPYGEIDLIAQLGDDLVFIEVKTRSNRDYGLPEESVTPKKQAHLIQAAQHYMQERSEFTGNWRIDVIAILGRAFDPNAEILYFENAVS